VGWRRRLGGGGRRKDGFLALGRESARVKRLFAAEWFVLGRGSALLLLYRVGD
jgi:hypothetical protein